MREEIAAPFGQRARVMRTQVFEVKDLQVTGAADGLRQRRDRGNEAAWEDVALDIIDRTQCLSIELILDRDRLQQHGTVRGQPGAAAPAIALEMLGGDRLDHLDR